MRQKVEIEICLRFEQTDMVSARVYIGTNYQSVPESLLKNNYIGGWLYENYPSWRIDDDSLAKTGAYVVELGPIDPQYPFFFSVPLRREIQ